MSTRFIIIGLIACIATSCGVLGDPEEQTIINLDEIYEISLHQDLKPGGNSLILNIATAKELQCPDATLNVHRTTLSNELSIRINNATEIKDCEPELVRLEESILTQLDDGNFDIQFIVNSIITDSGRLDIEDDYFQMVLTSFDGINLTNPILKMVPDSAVWGELYITQDIYSDELQMAKDQLLELIDLQKIEDGNYGYFTKIEKETKILNTTDQESIESEFFLGISVEKLTQILEWKHEMEATYPNIYFDIYHGTYGKL